MPPAPQDDQDINPAIPVDPAHQARLRRRALILTVASVAGAVLSLIAVIWITTINPRTDDAEVFANFIGMAPVVQGPILQLNVRDNQYVKQGQLLYYIDDRPYKYALESARSSQSALEGQIIDEQRRINAERRAVIASAAGTRNAFANVIRANASISEAQADVGNATAALDRAKAEASYAVNNLHRLEPLLKEQFVTVDQVDAARTEARARTQAVQQAAAQLNLAQARLNSMQAAYEQAQASAEQSTAQYHQSEASVLTLDPLVAQRAGRAAAVDNALYNYNQCWVYAPFDGRVTNLVTSEGQYAHIGQQIFTLIDTRVWWVIANFRETQLPYIRPGMAVDIFVMSHPHTPLKGVVESIGYGVTPDPTVVGTISPGLPNVRRTLSWVHLASRYPVRIRILAPYKFNFRLAESAVVVIHGSGMHL